METVSKETPSAGFDHAYFENMFAASDDPWQFRQRWYERRKRALTLAMLPKARYTSGFEPGCANGELAAELATRCDRLLASDGSPRAAALAEQRLADAAHVRVERLILPEQWPAERFDLVVISELGYYLDAAQREVLGARIEASLLPGGTFLACHWRHPIEGWDASGDDVHAAFDACVGLHRLGHYEDADLLLDVWSNDPRSVAQCEGL